MARSLTVNCNFCGKELEKVHSKVYLAPVLPGKAMVSYQAAYSHYADACEGCANNLMAKMTKRQKRSENGKIKTKVKAK